MTFFGEFVVLILGLAEISNGKNLIGTTTLTRGGIWGQMGKGDIEYPLTKIVYMTEMRL